MRGAGRCEPRGVDASDARGHEVAWFESFFSVVKSSADRVHSPCRCRRVVTTLCVATMILKANAIITVLQMWMFAMTAACVAVEWWRLAPPNKNATRALRLEFSFLDSIG